MKRFVQFIAGAICPDCKSKDTIALNPTNDEIYCVCLLYTSDAADD